MTTGRNEPCPCGSGKKFKKCHGASTRDAVATTEISRADALKDRDVELGDRLLRFARTRHGPRWLHDVLESEGLLRDGGIPDAQMPLVIPWLLHSREGEAGLTLAEEWSRHQRDRISRDDRLLLDAYRSAWVSLWEVAAVERGKGSRLTDVLTREERFVDDVRTSTTLKRFDTLLAMILTCDGVSFFGGLHAQPLPPMFAESVAREARRRCRVRTRPVVPEKLRDPEMQVGLLALWSEGVEDMRHQPPPIFQNTDGDPILLTQDVFGLLAPRADVARRLASFPGATEPDREGDDMVLTVVKTGSAVHPSCDNTVTGRIVLSASRLSVETNSTRRADALRSAIETHLAGLVRFRLRKEENTEQLLAAARESGPSHEPAEAVPPEAAAALRHFREQHLRDWLQASLPALDGLTPREAARLPGPRRKLETILKQFEQSEARLPEPQRIDLRWLWETLGFP